MESNHPQAETGKGLFANLVMMLATSAMQQLGRVPNPVTNKAETNLEGAQIIIDMIAMLKERTKGNTGNGEEKMLTDILSSLQMMYFEASQASAPESAKEPPKKEEEKDVTPKDADSKERKFHKAYE